MSVLGLARRMLVAMNAPVQLISHLDSQVLELIQNSYDSISNEKLKELVYLESHQTLPGFIQSETGEWTGWIKSSQSNASELASPGLGHLMKLAQTVSVLQNTGKTTKEAPAKGKQLP